jgi:hypothetical protein
VHARERKNITDAQHVPEGEGVMRLKGVQFPRKVRGYFETMMKRIGYRPLPTA